MVKTLSPRRTVKHAVNRFSPNSHAFDRHFDYPGKLIDDNTGLQNNLNRWYEPATGKWLSVDPIGFEGGDKNLYRYVLGNPINQTDPSGNLLLYTPSQICNEANRRRGNGKWKDSAQHCWAACYIGAVYQLGLAAAFFADVAECLAPSDDSLRDIAAQHFGAFVGEARCCLVRMTGSLGQIFLCDAATFCDIKCNTWPR
jgi:RHS repeat-associated protein